MASGVDDVCFETSPGEKLYVRNAVSVGMVIKELDKEPVVRANQKNTRLIAEALDSLERSEKVGNVHVHRFRGGRSNRANYYCRSGGNLVDWVTAESVEQIDDIEMPGKEERYAA